MTAANGGLDLPGFVRPCFSRRHDASPASRHRAVRNSNQKGDENSIHRPPQDHLAGRCRNPDVGTTGRQRGDAHPLVCSGNCEFFTARFHAQIGRVAGPLFVFVNGLVKALISAVRLLEQPGNFRLTSGSPRFDIVGEG